MSSRGSSSSGKQRRRSRPRRVKLLNIDVAEARRQVYQALLLHRTAAKSSVLKSSSSSSSASSSSHEVVNGTSTQLLQSMPQAEPTWSTTEPSVLPYSPYYEGAAMEAADIEFEWGENEQASAYAWWLAFLKSLDGNNNSTNVAQEFKYYYPLAFGSSSNWFFGQRPGGGNVKVEEAANDDDHEQIPSPDEWLILPTTENHEGEFNHVIP